MTPFIPILDARPTSSLHHGGPLDPPNLPYIPQQHDFHTCRDHIADLGLCRCGQSTITARRRCQDPCRTPPSGIGIEGIPFDLPQPPLLNFYERQRDYASQTPYWRSPQILRPADLFSKTILAETLQFYNTFSSSVAHTSTTIRPRAGASGLPIMLTRSLSTFKHCGSMRISWLRICLLSSPAISSVDDPGI